MVLNVQGNLSQEFAQVRGEGIQSLRNDVFERRESTGSGLFAMLGSDFDQLFGQIICMRNTKKYKFGSVTSGWRASLKTTFALITSLRRQKYKNGQ